MFRWCGKHRLSVRQPVNQPDGECAHLVRDALEGNPDAPGQLTNDDTTSTTTCNAAKQKLPAAQTAPAPETGAATKQDSGTGEDQSSKTDPAALAAVGRLYACIVFNDSMPNWNCEAPVSGGFTPTGPTWAYGGAVAVCNAVRPGLGSGIITVVDSETDAQFKCP